MSAKAHRCQKMSPGHAGFGLVDALVALALLAVTLLGACGSLHFALRATHAAAWQSRAVDLVADLNEDLQHADAAQPLATRLESWRIRLQQALPAADLAGIESRRLVVGASQVHWHDVRLSWNGTPGQPRASLRLPLAHADRQ
jgi:hypothetical protein